MPILAVFAILFAVWINYQIKRSYRNVKEKDDFWNTERKANFTRKADISTLDYIKIPVETLPFLSMQNEGKSSYTLPPSVSEEIRQEILHCEAVVLSLTDKKILNLTPFSNTELKLRFGASNLPILTEYEENFSKLTRALGKWGKLLFDLNEFSAAEKVLSFTVSCRADIEEVFLLLANLYHMEGNPEGLKSLEVAADCFDELRREHVLKRIKSI